VAPHFEFLIPRLAKMRAARSCRELWTVMSNDGAYRFQEILYSGLGVRTTLMTETSDEVFAACGSVVAALSPATQLR